MQIFNMLSEMKGSGSTSTDGGDLLKGENALSQEDVSAFLAQLELAYSQSSENVVGGLAWSEVQVIEEGALVDQSGSLLPLSPPMDGQLLPPQVTQAPQPEESILMQIKMAASGELIKLAPQMAQQVAPQVASQVLNPLQPQLEKLDPTAGLQVVGAIKSDAMSSIMPQLPTIAVTAVEQIVTPSHLPVSFSMLPPVTSPAAQLQLPQLPTINQPVGGRGWGENIGERIQWMVRQEIQGAEVKLNPRGLGPIEIRVTVQNDQTNVSFVAHHAVTREALDAAIPRLREMFSESNMNLVDVDVSDRNSAAFGGAENSASEKEGNGEEGRDAMTLFDDLNEEGAAEVRLVSNGMLDDYA